MERLTAKGKAGYYYPHCFREDACDGAGSSEECNKCGFSYKVCETLGNLEDLQEQGRLLEIPCAVGDTVYEVQKIRKRIQPYEVISVNISRAGRMYGWKLKDGKGIYSRIDGFSDRDLGKMVFLTSEEAEEALKRMEDGK